MILMTVKSIFIYFEHTSESTLWIFHGRRSNQYQKDDVFSTEKTSTSGTLIHVRARSAKQTLS